MEKHYPEIGRKLIPMRWGDMDAIGHLNNTYYFRYLEQVRVEWLDNIGQGIRPGESGPVIAATSCTFRRQMSYPATVEITLELERLGRSSITLRHHFYVQGDPETVYAYGDVTLVWVNYQTGQPVALPEVIRQVLAPQVAELEKMSV
ncbi:MULTISPECIES: thioesterase family protein [unclassified Paludibacterium]|uniref:acyl-CoA thioesterase n=1 Tax=unclassified Paludibacterium TaxID=2618429 RepID=UPI001C0543EE|nr:thioesterase family protein [Paludibacterium sp. B53371]BEV71572.1 thioesterase family protein [Paludibacterium sp. THUN1379]